MSVKNETKKMNKNVNNKRDARLAKPTKNSTVAVKSSDKSNTNLNHKQNAKSGATHQKKKFSPQVIAGIAVVLVACVAGAILGIKSNEKADYIVETNAFFAPFEFYDNRKIVGVDADIVDRVAEKMNKKINLVDVEFDVIIDNVEAGKIADAGVAGLTITPARAEKVDFSIPYYTSVQYVIFDKTAAPETTDGHVVWGALEGKKIGTQTGSTGYLFAADEIDTGVLMDTDTELKGFDSHQLAADAIAAHIVDYAVADELAAKFIVAKNENLEALPLYYTGEGGAADFPVEESYAVAVNKDRPELLTAFNEVLADMLTPDAEGLTEIDRLVLKYMGF
ncbi:amino acid ABC transporter substrate-binding protein [Candidatus Saccharibacteria bacterium]|nr:amino acid ABC transporter substrate-binding protein [Candidatus Saccharibacteria bacterium]